MFFFRCCQLWAPWYGSSSCHILLSNAISFWIVVFWIFISSEVIPSWKLLLINNFSIFLVLKYIIMDVMEHRCAGKLSGGFGGPLMYVISPTSTKPKYRVIKMGKRNILYFWSRTPGLSTKILVPFSEIICFKIIILFFKKVNDFKIGHKAYSILVWGAIRGGVVNTRPVARGAVVQYTPPNLPKGPPLATKWDKNGVVCKRVKGGVDLATLSWHKYVWNWLKMYKSCT